MAPRFLQIHWLTAYPSTLLNRDDAGFAKRIPFGGETRTRISSQCLKRHWRVFDVDWSLNAIDASASIRSCLTFDRYILQVLVHQHQVAPDLARAVTEAMMDELGSKAAKKKTRKNDEENDDHETGLRTGQITVLGHPEVDYLLSLARDVCEANPDAKKAAVAVKKVLGREGRKNLEAMRLGAGLGAALFGRMVTSDILARCDAAIHVAHAFTVHAEESESDYFSAIDDLLRDGEHDELGSGHIGSSELTSGLFYGYVVVDVPLLVSNIEGCPRSDWQTADRTLAATVVEHLIHLMATVSPGAKLGSTAPYAWAQFMMVESGDRQPRTLANAFLTPVRERPDLLDNTLSAMAAHLDDLDAMYGNGFTRRVSVTNAHSAAVASMADEAPMPIPELASWAADAVRG